MPALALAAPVLAPLFIARADNASATSFNLTASACLDNEATADPEPLVPGSAGECDGSSGAGAASAITTRFSLPAGDGNLAGLVNFTPPEWGVTPGSEVPDGAVVGTLSSQATFGIMTNACNNIIAANYTLMDATTDVSSTISLQAGFADGNGDSLPDAVTVYPDFLTRLFPGKTPRARIYGQTISAAGATVPINIVVFNPGTAIGPLTPDPRLGYPSVVILFNFGDPAAVPAPGPINDFCSPRATDATIYGTSRDNPATPTDEGGIAYRSNPSAAGNYNFVTFGATTRDADDDGIENELDPCPLSADPGWNPRAGTLAVPQAGDADGDRVPDSCDPDDASQPPVDDVDRDYYLNNGDNCATIANGINPGNGQIVGDDNQKDSDLDGIGDACDQHVTSADGHLHFLCGVTLVKIGAGGPAPVDPQTVQPCNPLAPLPSTTATPAADAEDGSPLLWAAIGAAVAAAAIALAAGGWYARRRLRR